MVIGGLLTSVSLFLAYQSKGLLIGETADAPIVESIRETAESDPDVLFAGRPLTMHFGPQDVLLNLDLQFRDGLSSEQIVRAVDRIEGRIRSEHPEVRRIYIETERLKGGAG